ncbi:J protein JJJ1 [Hypsizygus marmoreus]|uniref:J protein JJJ1 n=1 Tax=Hypsizygus marmoreus TaxID=39966 RepID=A0A369JHV6_HYPMA|nr:J protein JJJ1 [Hypsizygus marmoreus]
MVLLFSLVAIIIPVVSAVTIQAPANPRVGALTDVNWINSPRDPPFWNLFLMNISTSFDLKANFGQIDPKPQTVKIQLPVPMGAAPSSAQADFNQMDFYEVLDIDENATGEDIKRAYYKRSREHHPDKNLDDRDGATQRFTRILEAYERRAMYNAARAQKAHVERDTPLSTGSVPGAWNSDTIPQASKRGWFDWLFGWSTYRERFIFKNYLAAAQERGFPGDPGITMQDIIKFMKSLPEPLHWKLDDDHSEEAAFHIFHNLFLCLAFDEIQWGSSRDMPVFGCAHFIWCREDWVEYGNPFRYAPQAKEFYDFWSKFQTRKDFEWVEPYHIRPGYYDHSREREMRQANKAARIEARVNYNELIRAIVKSLLESDPRYRIHLMMETTRAPRPSPQSAQRETHQEKNEKKNEKKKKKKRTRGR